MSLLNQQDSQSILDPTTLSFIGYRAYPFIIMRVHNCLTDGAPRDFVRNDFKDLELKTLI